MGRRFPRQVAQESVSVGEVTVGPAGRPLRRVNPQWTVKDVGDLAIEAVQEHASVNIAVSHPAERMARQPGGRRTPIPGLGILRPLWDLGQLTPAGDPDLRIAMIWVEDAPELAPGTTGRIRLAPLDPTPWLRLRPGDVITMHEGSPAVAVATIVEATPALHHCPHASG